MDSIQVTLDIPLDLYQRAERMASLTQRKVTDVIATSIHLEKTDIEAEETPTETIEDQSVARERAAFIALHPVLLEKYADEEVAIYGGQVVDHDQDGVALSLRIYQRFPDDFVWIAPVTSSPIEEWHVYSPRFEEMSG
jgi:hypothetical protein